jgi:hypothetical protein
MSCLNSRTRIVLRSAVASARRLCADCGTAPGTLSLVLTALWGLIRRRLAGVA